MTVRQPWCITFVGDVRSLHACLLNVTTSHIPQFNLDLRTEIVSEPRHASVRQKPLWPKLGAPHRATQKSGDGRFQLSMEGLRSSMISYSCVRVRLRVTPHDWSPQPRVIGYFILGPYRNGPTQRWNPGRWARRSVLPSAPLRATDASASWMNSLGCPTTRRL